MPPGAGAKYLITLDGDGQHFPEDIPQFVSRLDPDTILIGSRREVIGKMPRSSRFGREFSDFWVCIESGAVVSDTQSGFRAYPLEAIAGAATCGRGITIWKWKSSRERCGRD